MASNEYYAWQPNRQSRNQPDLNAPLPPLPRPSSDARDNGNVHQTPGSPFNDYTYPLDNTRSFGIQQQTQDPFADDSAIPLQTQYPKREPDRQYPEHSSFHDRQYTPSPDEAANEVRRPRNKRSFLSRQTPWVTYTLTLIQVTVFIVELIRNAILTGSPIEIHPSFNPMIGPSPYVLINSGGRYVPCMRSQAGVQNSNTTISWPCANQTDSNPTCSLSQLCGFNGVPNPQVGGSLDAKPAPNQWFRFILPIFLHAGVVHIGFNMLLQILLGREMEKAIGHIRFTLVYFSSGIFGFIMGGNFAPSGIVSTGASGSLFGVIALLLLDLLYTWPTRPTPFRDLFYILLDITISFVLGLLPGLDNFSHIGGFLMGLVLGVCILRSPAALKRQRRGAEAGHVPGPGEGLWDEGSEGEGVRLAARGARHARTMTQSTAAMSEADGELSSSSPKRPAVSITESVQRPLPPLPFEHSSTPQTPHNANFIPNSTSLPPIPSPPTTSRKNIPYILFSLIRLAALAAGVTCTALLVQAFYRNHSTECGWCKYLSCLPVRDWCDVGDLVILTEGGGS